MDFWLAAAGRAAAAKAAEGMEAAEGKGAAEAMEAGGWAVEGLAAVGVAAAAQHVCSVYKTINDTHDTGPTG